MSWRCFWRHKHQRTVMSLGTWRHGVTIYSRFCPICNKDWRFEVY